MNTFRPMCKCPSTFPEGNFYMWASCVGEDMIKSIILLGRICFLLASSLICLKTHFFARQNLICHGHPQVLTPSAAGPLPGTLTAKHPCFCKWTIVWAINHYISVSHTLKKEKLGKESALSRRLIFALNISWNNPLSYTTLVVTSHWLHSFY